MDLCVYFEVDSFLPLAAEFEFLRKSSYKNSDLLGEGFRLKTMKFRGQISQGLVMPIDVFPDLDLNRDKLEIGMDVTELLGVRKWEIEERATTGGNVIGELPYCVPHTDETRVQAEPGLIQEFSGLDYYITTKMDGSSHSIAVDEDGWHVCGHNYEYKNDGSSSFYEFVNEHRYLDILDDYYKENGLDSIVIQGEFCAPGIQRNRLKLKKPEWYVFTVIINGKRAGLAKLCEICDELGYEIVPIEEVGEDLPAHYPTVESLLARADGCYPNGGKKEGIVIRPCVPVHSYTISAPLSMKVVNNNYLLKNDA
jgi:RNA ligase (TIGR02306 family)